MAYGMMGDVAYQMMGGVGGWLMLAGIFYFALAVFIFSVIFWLTHNWLVPQKKR